MESFSWTDIWRAAFSSCLPWLTTNRQLDTSSEHDHQRLRLSQYEELEGLLADTGDTDDADAETVSLHSNFGNGRENAGVRRKKRNMGKGLTVFGWNLFGKPPIQLSEDEEPTRRRRTRAHPFSSTSSSTLDSDAAPLDPAAIDRLSSPIQTVPAELIEGRVVATEEEVRRQKEERKQRRRERRELRRAAQALHIGFDDPEFEGYQGSGPLNVYPQSQFSPSATSPSTIEEFGPYVGGVAGVDEEVDADAADLGGEMYVQRPATSGASNVSGSRSGTSASQSNVGFAGHHQYAYNHHYISQQPQAAYHIPQQSAQLHHDHVAEQSQHKKKKKKASSASNSSSKISNSSTSQSTSLHSPKMPPSINAQIVDSGPLYSHHEDKSVLQTSSAQDSAGFPSVGFGGMRRKNSDMGAFLARRGDD